MFAYHNASAPLMNSGVESVGKYGQAKRVITKIESKALGLSSIVLSALAGTLIGLFLSRIVVLWFLLFLVCATALCVSIALIRSSAVSAKVFGLVVSTSASVGIVAATLVTILGTQAVMMVTLIALAVAAISNALINGYYDHGRPPQGATPDDI